MKGTKCILLLCLLMITDCYCMVENNDINKVWRIKLGHDYGPYEYMDEGGYLTGFSYELLAEVCLAAGINCYPMWDHWTNCWKSNPGAPSGGGIGLMDQWYDACVNWYMTVDRVHVFSFSEQYLLPPTTYFYIKKGSNFDPSDMQGKTIGFMDGWASDARCMARQDKIKNNVLDVKNTMHYKDTAHLVNAINNGDVSAGFSTGEELDNYVSKGQLDRVPQGYSCVLSGDSVMARKGNDFIKHWNTGMSILRNNGKFTKMCEDAQKRHGSKGNIYCAK